ncbi:hypothetical protein A3A69_01990 [candidate division WWE3 bacterium RIFCSPLOWO2_01_FULL_37_15]|uniref:MalT-like TPR region domain-containing protein n=1 Tax=candidate division WWE3 bacterium RIFCSPLOWO2_01_FULL_37_15 TaxID=1802622 RepID=A0A1F4UXM5_UNCKA|nr:MAG: hypothetical protein A3A69_01990 [candidate division WWE3 bacterium RIFCSPLOWO2_01_FULL_37_15]
MTSMNGSFLVCLRNGEKFLVDGWLEHALSAFEYARSLARNQTERSQAWACIGLTYLEMLEREKADEAFQMSSLNAKVCGYANVTLEADRNKALMVLEKGDAARARRLGQLTLDEASKLGRRDLIWFVHVVTRAQVRLHKTGDLVKTEALYWVLREILEYLYAGCVGSGEVTRQLWWNGIKKSHRDMYGVLLAPFMLLVNFHRARRQVKSTSKSPLSHQP